MAYFGKISPRLSDLFFRGSFRFLGIPVYKGAVGLELAIQRFLDGWYPLKNPDEQVFIKRHLTAIVKTFERPHILQRLVDSLRRRYPELPVIVVDDSRSPQKLPGVETIVMPFDCGVSAGRNRALEKVASNYVLVLDDDYIFYRHTQLFSALQIMEANPQIDIMGGQVVNLPFFNSNDYQKSNIFSTNVEATLPPGSQIAGLPVYDKVANFYIARTERLRLVPWSEQLKRLDHADFFTRAKGVLTTVFNQNLRCLHARTPYSLAHRSTSYDTAIDHAVLRLRYDPERSSKDDTETP